MWALCCALLRPLALTAGDPERRLCQCVCPKTLRASMGAAVRIPVIEAGAMPDAITRLREKGITCLAAALYKSQPLSAAQASCPGGVCVVIGSEGQGLTDETIAACSSTVRIPMTDRVESLNAGIAGSILLWHFREESL